MGTIAQRSGGHYDVEEVEFGKVYRWRPERIKVACGCGQVTPLTTASTATCDQCGANLAVVLQEEPAAGQLRDETIHPWRYDRDCEGDGLPC